MPVQPILLHGPSFLSTVLEKFRQLAGIFWANGLPPPLAKNCPYAYDQTHCLLQDSIQQRQTNRQTGQQHSTQIPQPTHTETLKSILQLY